MSYLRDGVGGSTSKSKIMTLARNGHRISIDSSLPKGPRMDPSYTPKVLKRCVSGQTMASMTSSGEVEPVSKIAVLYTGGTIGMKSHGGGRSTSRTAANVKT